MDHLLKSQAGFFQPDPPAAAQFDDMRFTE